MKDGEHEMAAPLDWISVEGFRSIKRLERLPLKPINVLIGANGSGKSNLIQVFALLRAWHLGKIDEYVARTGGASRNLHFGAKVTDRLQIGISFANGNAYDLKLEPTEDDRLGRHEQAVGPLVSVPVQPEVAGAVSQIHETRPLFEAMKKERLDQWRVYHFHDTGRGAPLLRTAQLDDSRFLREDGENIAAFLYRLKKKEQSAYARICDTFRFVAPFFDDFVLEPQALNEQMIRLEWRHRTSDAHFDISAFSDGALRFLALATLLLQPAKLRPSVILLDEPELGLHPRAITMLCSLISSVATETQVVLTTQSPFLVDHFEPEDVVAVDRVGGSSVFTRLPTERLEAWLEDYSLGDLWIKNELGGCPSYETSHDIDGQ